jgi:hypothetical protein
VDEVDTYPAPFELTAEGQYPRCVALDGWMRKNGRNEQDSRVMSHGETSTRSMQARIIRLELGMTCADLQPIPTTRALLQ